MLYIFMNSRLKKNEWFFIPYETVAIYNQFYVNALKIV